MPTFDMFLGKIVEERSIHIIEFLQYRCPDRFCQYIEIDTKDKFPTFVVSDPQRKKYRKNVVEFLSTVFCCQGFSLMLENIETTGYKFSDRLERLLVFPKIQGDRSFLTSQVLIIQILKYSLVGKVSEFLFITSIVH